MDLQNALVRLVPNTAFVSGTITTPNPTTGTPTLTNLSGTVDFDQSAVSITRTGAGNYALSITNFNPLGGAGVCFGLGSVSTTGASINSVATAMVWTEPGTYSSDTATVNFHALATSTSVAVDAQINFLVMAY